MSFVNSQTEYVQYGPLFYFLTNLLKPKCTLQWLNPKIPGFNLLKNVFTITISFFNIFLNFLFIDFRLQRERGRERERKEREKRRFVVPLNYAHTDFFLYHPDQGSDPQLRCIRQCSNQPSCPSRAS